MSKEKTMNYTLEICANSTQSALNAQEAGATRVELCSNLWESGTTPSYGTIKKARSLLDIQLFVLIRPRGGDFVYSDLEFDLMREDILMCRELGVDGIVSGVLNADNNIDISRTQQLIEWTKPLPFTFHRAFDITPDLFQSLEVLINLGVDRVLTSGGKDSAADACDIISSLQQLVAGKTNILPGGGINETNIVKLLGTGCSEFHMTGNAVCKRGVQQNRLYLNGTRDIPENDYLESSLEKIRMAVAQLNDHFEQ